MVKRWRIHSHDPDRIAVLQREAGIPAVAAQLLICRGISDPLSAKRFLDPKLSHLRDPEQLPGCSQAAERIHQAIRDGRRIVIYGDYDVDGMTGTALLRQCIKMLGGNVGYYVPHRIDEGYGLNHEAIRSLAAEKAELIVTVDCGIASVEEAITAKECGLELIVTDHHEPNHRLPEAAAIVHPALPGHSYPFQGLSGAGVALKLAWALCQQASGASKVGQKMKDFLFQAVGLAALGTVADVVPLVDENRVLVRHGLERSLRECPPLGLKTLIGVAKLDTGGELGSEDIAFSLAPRLNAAGRLEQAQLAIELLLTDQPDRARELATYIDGLNQNRQKLERSIYLAAHKQAKEQFDPTNDAALVLADRGWHPGVIGIVAGRLAEKYHRPVVIVSWDRLGVKPGSGSARSVPGFDLHAALSACDEHLLSHGGHAAAAGLRIKEEKLESFRADFCEYASSELTHEQRTAELHVDAEFPLGAFTLKVVGQIEQLAPFGHGNARPLLAASGVTMAEPPRVIGSGGQHLSMRLKQHDITLRAVAFGGGEWGDELAALDRPIDIAFRPVINTFRGRRNVELHLVDWRKAANEGAVAHQ
ncbi:MAG: single-stranded-DNA-specific exonuclease RecJ [Planctomycetes bacterium RBG_16_64_12]|nr:MAG: single-stranded-DNA-specific exonuclease RecJ [Planctomycetes bacterium RBG_16_64_12]